MHINLTSLCVCLVLLFGSAKIATAQSMAAPDSTLPGVATSRPEPPLFDSLEIAESRGDATTLSSQEPNPLPQHTGFGTLAKDTVSDFVAFPKRKSTWVILASGGGAALLAHQADDYVADPARAVAVSRRARPTGATRSGTGANLARGRRRRSHDNQRLP